MERDKTYILHILDELDAIQTFVANMSFEEFVADLRTTKAVERSLEIIQKISLRNFVRLSLISLGGT